VFAIINSINYLLIVGVFGRLMAIFEIIMISIGLIVTSAYYLTMAIEIWPSIEE